MPSEVPVTGGGRPSSNQGVGGGVVERIIGEYEVERLLGRGGMARVWLARHRILGVRRALKELSVADPQRLRRLVREGRIQAALAHRNLVPVVDVVCHGAVTALVMEYVEGPDLSELIAVRPLALPEIDTLAVGMMDGLAAAHAAGVVHRDLKPHNVLLAEVDGDLVPRIADFGIAKVRESTRTRAGEIFGTPRYMAPEQFEDASAVDERADLFSLGCILYELVIGHPPFDAEEPVATYQRILTGSYRPVRKARPETPARMATAIEACLRVDPSRRPASCEALRAHWSPPAHLVPVRITPEERVAILAKREARRGSGSDAADRSLHLAPARLLATALHAHEEAHLAECAGCRVERRHARALAVEQPTPTRHHPLPRRIPHLVDRARELAEAERLLRDGAPLITFKGPGGAGKTTLAVAVARRWVERGAGTAWFCDLTEVRTVDPDRDPLAAVAVIDEALSAHGPRLLVLDNCEQLIDRVAQRVGSWLGEPGLVVLVTSRERLDLSEEQVLEVGPMAPEEARSLFRVLAANARPGLDLDRYQQEIVGIVERLDRIPLAIDLAAARVRAMTPRAILERLERRFELLASTTRDRSARQATLRGALDWSWELLHPWEQQVLAQCSVFRGGFCLDAAESVLVTGTGAPWLPDVVQALVDKSLLRLDDGERYAMLETVRAYADEKLGAGPAEAAEAARSRHLAWYLSAPVTARDLPNLVKAARCALSRGDDDTATLLAMRIGALVSG